MIPARVALGTCILGGIFGFLVGKGADPLLLLVLPLIVAGFIYANTIRS